MWRGGWGDHRICDLRVHRPRRSLLDWRRRRGMTKDEAIRAAEAFVSRKYSHVPRVVSVSHLTVRGDRFFIEHWSREPGATRWREALMEWDESQIEDVMGSEAWREARAAAGEALRISPRWTVHFFMSWDTDELGMPQTLRVQVDD